MPSTRWRSAADLPPAPLLLSSPYAPEARDGQKRETAWTGYKVPVTETCDDETPNLSTDVMTTAATTSDFAVLPTMQAHLAARQLRPGEQLVDSGYGTADHLLTSRTEHGIDRMGPVADDQSWHGQSGNGFAAARCVIDGDAKSAICPQGQRSVVWMERPDRHGHATVRLAFLAPEHGRRRSLHAPQPPPNRRVSEGGFASDILSRDKLILRADFSIFSAFLVPVQSAVGRVC